MGAWGIWTANDPQDTFAVHEKGTCDLQRVDLFGAQFATAQGRWRLDKVRLGGRIQIGVVESTTIA